MAGTSWIEPDGSSLRRLWQSLTKERRAAALSGLSPQAASLLKEDWETILARPEQLPPPGDWMIWLISSGRGFGKTRSGAQWTVARARSGRFSRIALIGETAADVRDVMVEGPSGILACCPNRWRPRYYPSRRLVLFPNGVRAHTYSGEEPDQLRGPEHDTAWADEVAKWKHQEAAWDNMEMGLRIGPQPQCCATTTPKNTPLIKKLLSDPDVVVTRGHTLDNAANLSPRTLRRLMEKYSGTRLGLQELEGKLLEDRAGALWTRDLLDQYRVPEVPELRRIVVAVDPSVSDGETAAECGIVAAGLGRDGHGYTLADRSLRGSPLEWAREAVSLWSTLQADRVVAEKNQGGLMVETTLRTVKQTLPITLVSAARNKQARAEPVAALYEQGRVHHVGRFADLEDQLCDWVPGDGESPDRLDALVWAYHELFKLGEEVLPKARGRVAGLGVKGWTTGGSA